MGLLQNVPAAGALVEIEKPAENIFGGVVRELLKANTIADSHKVYSL